MLEQIFFYGLATLLVLNSLMVVTRKNPVASAVFLVATLFLLAALYASLGADFIAAIQILVYAGAIMVLFLFVIMLLNLDMSQLSGPKISPPEIVVLILTLVSIAGMAIMVAPGNTNIAFLGEYTDALVANAGGNTRVVGLKLFQDYVWPFEIASLLILLAIVASVMIAKKDTTPRGKVGISK